MKAQETVGAIAAELTRRIGHGRLGRLQRALNVGKNFFSYWKAHLDSARLFPLAEALEYLEIEPAEFFASAFKHVSSPMEKPSPDGRDVGTDLEAPTKSSDPTSESGRSCPTASSFPSGEPPIGVQKALERTAELSAPPKPPTEEMIDRQELARLEMLRLDNPRKVNKSLEGAIHTAPIELLAELLATYGVTFRQLDMLGDARWAFFAAPQFTDDPVIQAAILQKSAWVEDSDGNPTTAMENLRQASGIFTELAAWNRVGKVLVDQAILFFHRGNFTAALKCAISALTKLDNDEYENRFSAHQVQALSHQSLQAPAEALNSLNAARQVSTRCCKASRIRFAWLNANMRREMMHPLEAATAFDEAATFFSESGDVLSELLATLEFANCHLLAGNHSVVNATAVALKRFAFREPGKLVESVIMNVYRIGLEGRSHALGEVLHAALGTVKAAVEKSTAASPN